MRDTHYSFTSCTFINQAGVITQLEDRLQNKVIAFAWQKQSIPKRRNNGSLIMKESSAYSSIKPEYRKSGSWADLLSWIQCVSKILMKLLYLAWLRRERQFGVLHFLAQI